MSRIPPQTTRQAKAAHKARKGNVLSEAEQRLIERDTLLHRRAWAIQEREKTRLVAAQKRAEREQRERAELADAARFATQRRVDRFGHKSSQCHLRAFFSKASEVKHSWTTTCHEDHSDRDSFDEGIDEEAILSVLKTPTANNKPEATLTSNPDKLYSRPIGMSFTPDADSRCSDDHGVEVDWLAFESSTQIARDLNGASRPGTPASRDCASRPSSHDSTGSSLGLTSQDIEKIDPSIQSVEQMVQPTTSKTDREAMPPPTVPSIMSPRLSTHQLDGCADITSVDHLGFSSTQLEAYVEDDLILTQA